MEDSKRTEMIKQMDKDLSDFTELVRKISNDSAVKGSWEAIGRAMKTQIEMGIFEDSKHNRKLIMECNDNSQKALIEGSKLWYKMYSLYILALESHYSMLGKKDG